MNNNSRSPSPLHSAKVTVWCGLNSSKIVSPNFIEDAETGTRLTVTEERYTDMLTEVFPEGSENVNSNTIFMQDLKNGYILVGSPFSREVNLH